MFEKAWGRKFRWVCSLGLYGSRKLALCLELRASLMTQGNESLTFETPQDTIQGLVLHAYAAALLETRRGMDVSVSMFILITP